MSLLLEALQKASKNHLDDASITAPVKLNNVADLMLEPRTSAQRDASSESAQVEAVPPASPEYAADVMQANDSPGYSILDWVRDHHMQSFLAFAALFAVVYGLYVYIQISNPGMLQSSPPLATAPIQRAALAPPIETASKPARISGLPIEGASENTSARTNASETSITSTSTGDTSNDAAAGATSAAGAGNTKPRGNKSAATAVASTKAETQPARTTRTNRAASRPTPARQFATSSNDVEIVDIPASPTVSALPADPGVAGRNISVQQRDAAVSQIDSMLLLAYESMQEGQFENANSLYSQVLAQDPDSIDALLGLAAISWKRGGTDVASQFYGRVLELEPRNSYAQAGLIALLGNADPVAAESKLKQLIGREPSGFLYFTLGNLYAEQGKWARAQDAYFQAYQFQPNNADYAFNLAVGLEHLGQTRLALQYYRTALDLSFAQGRANFDQGLAIERVGQLSARVD
jgi:Flp pilus assembly protein TadD